MTACILLSQSVLPDSFALSFPDALVVVRNGLVVRVNATMEALSGLSARVLCGQAWSSLIQLSDREKERGDKAGFHVGLLAKNGRHTEVKVSLIRNAPDLGEGVSADVWRVRPLHDCLVCSNALFPFAHCSGAGAATRCVYRLTPDGRCIYVSPDLAALLGHPDCGDLAVSLPVGAFPSYVDPACGIELFALAQERGYVRDFEMMVSCPDHVILWVSQEISCVVDDRGEPLFYEAIVRDITACKEADERLRLLVRVFESTREGIVLLDESGGLHAANPAFVCMTGLSGDVAETKPLRLLAEGLHDPDCLDRILETVRVSGHWAGELFIRDSDGEPFPAEAVVSAVHDDHGQTTHFVVRLSDVTARKNDEAWVRFHANYDLLTGLPNRRLLMERLESALETACREGKRGCVLLVDLDRFKAINDAWGHAAGDELLRLLSRRLNQCVGSEDSVGRLGGDEFLVLMPEVETVQAGVAMAERILHALQEPFSLAGTEQFCQLSIGIALFPDDGLTAGDVLRNTDVAMQVSKKHAVRRYTVYDSSMSAAAGVHPGLENDLRLASVRGELELYYQPKVDAVTLKIRGAEALIRWHHPVYGMVSPAEFVPIAEETGLIVPIGRWVLRRACVQLVNWLRSDIGVPSVSVNVSLRQFQDPGFVASVRQILDETGLDPVRLDLEITESVMTGDVSRAVTILRELKDLGVTLSMDDFGTGYSSLTWLKTFPIDTLKIDQTFVRDLSGSGRDAAIVTTIITLARNLGFGVVAEGVEHTKHVDLLREMGCDAFQGYWIARPLPPRDFADFVAARKAGLVPDGVMSWPA